MGIYPTNCPSCDKQYNWFSGNRDQHCEACKSLWTPIPLNVDSTLTVEMIENAAIQSLANFGKPESLFHPDHGWLIQDGQVTEVGKEYFSMLRRLGIL